MQYVSDTILALATPPGRSGVAVLRVSGANASDALLALGVSLPQPRVATLAPLMHPQTHEVLDKALILWFPGPASFTGEDTLELQVHGSRAVIASIVDALTSLPGIRLAEAGEFSRRAFLNGKMDLTDIEGLADLLDAETDMQRRQGRRTMQGDAGRKFNALRAEAVRALARLEAWIDFPDEEIPPDTWKLVMTGVEELRNTLTQLLNNERQGERIRDGVSIVILGAPNAGKSSLMNALAKRDVAIVSHIAGTTRDVIETHLNLGGYAAILVDTAGLRSSDDPIECEGIERARARALSADLRVICFDSTASPDQESMSLLDDTSIAVATKNDRASSPLTLEGHSVFPVSSTTGNGLDCLVQELKRRVIRLTSTTEAPLITRARHREALQVAITHLNRFSPELPTELACEELRRSASEIGKITGKILNDELLDVVFREFCIGK